MRPEPRRLPICSGLSRGGSAKARAGRPRARRRHRRLSGISWHHGFRPKRRKRRTRTAQSPDILASPECIAKVAKSPGRVVAQSWHLSSPVGSLARIPASCGLGSPARRAPSVSRGAAAPDRLLSPVASRAKVPYSPPSVRRGRPRLLSRSRSRASSSGTKRLWRCHGRLLASANPRPPPKKKAAMASPGKVRAKAKEPQWNFDLADPPKCCLCSKRTWRIERRKAGKWHCISCLPQGQRSPARRAHCSLATWNGKWRSTAMCRRDLGFVRKQC